MDDGGKIELLRDREQQVRSKSLKKSFHGLKSLKKFEKLTPAAGVCPPHSSRGCWQRPAPNVFA